MSKKKVYKLADQLKANIHINIQKNPLDVNVDAPHGFYWKASESHSLVGCQTMGEPVAEVWESLFLDMSEGLGSCQDGECNGECDFTIITI